MLDMNDKAKVRQAVLVEGKSQRAVAREMGYSRNTVAKMLTDSQPPQYQLIGERLQPVLGPYKAIIDAWVTEDKKKIKKKRRTAKRMYTILKKEYGYQGAESTLRRYVGQARRKARHKVYLPLAYEPGEVAQVDFGEAEVVVAGTVVTAQLFLLWLGYSSSTFLKAYPGQPQEVFFDGHAASFSFFGGVPRHIWYDNLKIAVAKVLEGRNRQEQEAFVSFRSYYLYEAHFCNTAAGWEKGGVEGRVGYCRRNWLLPRREFPSWEVLNSYLAEQCQSEWQRRLRGQDETIGQRLAAEKEAFLPLPARPHPCCKTLPVRANHLSLVSFNTNRYSVPVDHSHEKLLLRAYVDRVEISNGRELLASHARCWEREQDILNPLHYLPLLARRPRALAQARAIRQWRADWPPVFDRYWDVLQQKLPERQSTATFIRILRLCEDHPETLVAQALEQALSHHCYDDDGVRELLRRLLEPDLPPPLNLTHQPALAEVQVTPTDLTQFDRLLSAGGSS